MIEREKIIEIWRNHRRGTITGIIIGTLALLAFYLNCDALPEFWAGNSRLEKRLSHLQNRQEELRQAYQREVSTALSLREIRGRCKDFWCPERDGDPQQDIRRKVEQAARDAGLKLKALGTLQTGKILEGVNTYEMNIVADAQLEEIVRMMGTLEQMTPRFYWKNLTVTPDNLNRPRHLVFNATVKVVAVVDPELSRRLWPVSPEGSGKE